MRLAQKSAKNVCQVICFQCRFLRLGSIPRVYNPYPSLTSKRHNNIIVLVIATFNEDGFLPPGIHWTDWPEFVQRFGLTTHRNKLIQGLVESSQKLASAGCRAIYIDGSFVTSKEHPGDFDACWDLNNVDVIISTLFSLTLPTAGLPRRLGSSENGFPLICLMETAA